MKSIFKKIFLVILIILTIINITIVSTFAYFWNKNEITDLGKLIPDGNIKIYDSNDKLIANLSETYNSYASYQEIPKVMIDAIIAIEDSRFFSHEGIDYKGIARALSVNLKKQGFSEGASTITQQLVKNLYLSNEKTLKRKINEAILSLKLEQIISKEDIIASYLSNVLFGGRIYGIKMACKYYFNCSLKALDLNKAALLAGLVQMPNYYNPFKNYDAAVKRRNLVLDKMYEQELISLSDLETTKAIDLKSVLEKGIINEDIGVYSSYIDYVMNELEQYNTSELTNQNIQIKINADKAIQTYVSEIMFNKYQTFPDNKMACGIIVLNNQDGKILAIGGSREKGLKNLNYATDVYNQPGSTIKPILSYGPCIEYLNYSPLMQINDELYKYPSGQVVKNWDNLYKGYISIRKALSESRNVPAIKLYKTIGDENAWRFANSLGLVNRDSTYHESMAIGGFEKGFSVLEMANAYQAFANMGYFIKANGIEYVSVNGIKQYTEEEKSYVMKPSTAFLINNILHDVLSKTSYDLNKTYLSSKTGQSNYDEATRKKYKIPMSATKDSWAIGYTKDLTVAVWSSYDNLNEGNYLTPVTKNIPINIMSMILRKFAKNNQYYQAPKNLSYLSVDVINGKLYCLASDSKNIKSDYFINGFIPLPRDNSEYEEA